jgi:adenylate cyclase
MNQAGLQKVLVCVLIAVLVSVIASLLYNAGLYSNIQLKLSDYLYGGGKPFENIVIIAIDDKSIQDIGRWPWDREVFADLLQKTKDARVVAFDVAFFEKSTSYSDMILAQSINSSGNVVIPVEYSRFSKIDGVVAGHDVMTPIPELIGTAALGYINVITDADGITRSVNLNIKGDYEPFAEVIANKYIKTKPTNSDRQLVNFLGVPGTFKRYSFSDVRKGIYPADEFKGKLVLVGATAPDLHDEYFVPTSAGKAMPGVEIHANLIQQLISGKQLFDAPELLTIISIVITALIVAFVALYLPIIASIIITIALMIAFVFVTIIVFSNGIILNLVYVPATAVPTYMVSILYSYIAEKKSRKAVLGAFEKYVSKEVASHILADPKRLKLGGEKRTITIFFSDIRGFTTLSEKLSPEELVKLLNDYLSEMTGLILKNNGVVDKYIGDAIMAFWNAPLNQPDHATLACRTCLEMEQKLKKLQSHWDKQGLQHIEIGIGLNTGKAVVGNMGSESRFDYTAMGDTVNLGSRLEGLNKAYGTRIIISETTAAELDKKMFLVRMLDKVKVKGKNEPITIYELVSKSEDAEKWYAGVITHFEKGLEHYFKQDWDHAISEFNACLKLRPEDKPSGLFIDRCKHFKKEHPGKDWDGVWVMKEK